MLSALALPPLFQSLAAQKAEEIAEIRFQKRPVGRKRGRQHGNDVVEPRGIFAQQLLKFLKT